MDRAGWAAPLCRPAALAALVALAVNDHVLKGAGLVPAAITGKLSDVAGLFLAPIALWIAARGVGAALGCPRFAHARWLTAAAAAITAAAFAAVQCWPPAHAAASAWLGPNVMDPSDLLALPMAAASWLWMRRALAPREPREPRALAPHTARLAGDSSPPVPRGIQVAVAIAAVLVCAATSAPRLRRNYPRWVPDAQRAARVEGCAALSAFVSKSGKTGVGVSVAVRGRGSDGGPCRVEIAQAHLELAGADIAPIPAKTLGAPVEVAAGQVAYIYVPFAFDNNAMWNAHIRDGAFVFTPVVDGHRAVPWRIPATHRLDGYHTSRDGYHTPRDRARSAEPQPDIPAIAQ